MATLTPLINLIVPASGEYFNTWWKPVNTNWATIDTILGGVNNEVVAARGNLTSLSARLASAIDANGNPLSAPEVTAAESSSVYNSDNGTSDYALQQRLEIGDREVWDARQQQPQLIDSLAWGADYSPQNTVNSAATNYLTFSGAIVTLNAGTTPMLANINGYQQEARVNKPLTISGSAGTYYLYIQRNLASGLSNVPSANPSGESYYTLPAASGAVGLYTPNGKLQVLTSTGGNFITAGVQPGDIIVLTTGSQNSGQWIVLATNVEDPTNLAVNQVRIVGNFNSAQAGLDGALWNPISPTFSFTPTAHSPQFARVQGKVFIGRIVFDGTNVTSLIPYALNGIYDAFSSVSAAPNFSLTVSHDLGYFPKRVLFYGSQAGDYSQPLEVLAVAQMSAGVASLSDPGSVTLTPGSITFNAGNTTLSPNTGPVLTYVAPTLTYTSDSVTYVPPTLTYTAPVLQRAVICQFSDTTISIKNATSGLFYVDFGGTPQASGFLRVVCER